MLLLTHEKAMGNDGVIVMGDVAVTPNPTADQLAQIAYTTAQTAHSVAGMTEPYIAMLSYSTKGSAKDAINKETGKSVYVIDKVKDAVSIAHEKYPELHVDGELQADAALVPAVATKKAPKEARWLARPTCSLCPTSRWATSATNSCSVWVVPWLSARSSRVSHVRSTTSAVAAR